MHRSARIRLALSAFILVGACSGKDADDKVVPSAPTASSPTASSAPAPKAGGKVIVVELYSDEKGNYYKPNNVEALRGDVIRFTLMSGVHNVHFLSDSNPGKADLPVASDFLQIPGQTFDLVVGLAPGRYYFQCDPHALLGMIGHINVGEGK